VRDTANTWERCDASCRGIRDTIGFLGEGFLPSTGSRCAGLRRESVRQRLLGHVRRWPHVCAIELTEQAGIAKLMGSQPLIGKKASP